MKNKTTKSLKIEMITESQQGTMFNEKLRCLDTFQEICLAIGGEGMIRHFPILGNSTKLLS